MLRLRVLLTICLVLLLAAGLAAQDNGKIKQLTPTYSGSTGLFSTPFADTLRQGEFSFSLNAYYAHREPGDLSLTVFPITATVGLTDRIEFFASYEIHKRVHASQIQTNTVFPGANQTPTQIGPRGCLPNDCTTSFFNDTPFLDVGFGSGPGELSLGAKFNILSERRGDALGLAVQPVAKFHLDASRGRLARGLSSGANDAGFDFILSKDMPNSGTFTASSGLMITGDPNGVDRQNEWNFGLGVGVPLGSAKKVHFIGELTGTVFYGERRGLANPHNPVDVIGGLRAFPAKWLAISGGYMGYVGANIDEAFGIDETDRHGFWAQLALQRKINRPPTVSCNPAQTTITEGESATVNARVSDPDDDNLTMTWSASGGRLSDSGTSATFDSTGLEAGRYTVKLDVSDGEATASCSADVNVEKNKQPPTITCQPGSVSVTKGESATLNAQASDPNGDALTYSWTVNGQSVSNNSPTFEFGTAQRNPGSYTVEVTVTDVDGMTASCSFDVTVNRRPNNCPEVSLSVDPTEVYAGEDVQATAQISDPDGDPFTVEWSVDGRTRTGSGNSFTIDTSGLAGGSHTVEAKATDDRGCEGSDSATFNVTEKVIIQMPLDNIGKAKLDEIALKMQQEPRLRAVITGYTDDTGSEAVNERVGLRRANRAKAYLVDERGISEDRIEVKSGGETNPIADNSTAEGRKENRRVEVELSVP
ncbi:MAG TPA: PKD domain-containing protein [Acidobacteriota bacterium]|nr:PKD domain-containing protein [Acidobacteriota bacterium]